MGRFAFKIRRPPLTDLDVPIANPLPGAADAAKEGAAGAPNPVDGGALTPKSATGAAAGAPKPTVELKPPCPKLDGTGAPVDKPNGGVFAEEFTPNPDDDITGVFPEPNPLAPAEVLPKLVEDGTEPKPFVFVVVLNDPEPDPDPKPPMAPVDEPNVGALDAPKEVAGSLETGLLPKGVIDVPNVLVDTGASADPTENVDVPKPDVVSVFTDV